jgi:5'-3' exonuclease
MQLHLVDGTYELFRNFYGAPAALSLQGLEVGAALGLCRTLLALVASEGATHLAIAFHSEIEPFRNEIFPEYKASDSTPPALLAQFALGEQIATALGFCVWSVPTFEAADALATAAARFQDDAAIEQILLCSPDKALAQCVNKKVVCLDRRQKKLLDEDGVREKFSISPESIPDWLALVGDATGGIPGIPGFGPKAASALLARYKHIEAIPQFASSWWMKVRGAPVLADTLFSRRQDAILYRELATLRRDVPLTETVEDLLWRGALLHTLPALCTDLGEPSLLARVPKWHTGKRAGMPDHA